MTDETKHVHSWRIISFIVLNFCPQSLIFARFCLWFMHVNISCKLIAFFFLYSNAATYCVLYSTLIFCSLSRCQFAICTCIVLYSEQGMNVLIVHVINIILNLHCSVFTKASTLLFPQYSGIQKWSLITLFLYSAKFSQSLIFLDYPVMQWSNNAPSVHVFKQFCYLYEILSANLKGPVSCLMQIVCHYLIWTHFS